MGQGMLEHVWYRVTVAANGTETWKLFWNPSRFDLVVTDQTMADMTGVTLAQRIFLVR